MEESNEMEDKNNERLNTLNPLLPPLYTSFELHPCIVDGEEKFILMDFNTFPGHAVAYSALKPFLHGVNEEVCDGICNAYAKRYKAQEKGELIVPLPWSIYPLFNNFSHWDHYITYSYHEGSVFEARLLRSLSAFSEQDIRLEKTFEKGERKVTQLNGNNVFMYLSSPRVALQNICDVVMVDFFYRSLSVLPELYLDLLSKEELDHIYLYSSKLRAIVKREHDFECDVISKPYADVKTQQFVVKDMSFMNSGGKAIQVIDETAYEDVLKRYFALSKPGIYNVLISPLIQFNKRYLIDFGGKAKAFHLRCLHDPYGEIADAFFIKMCDYKDGLNNTSAGRETFAFVKQHNKWLAFEIVLSVVQSSNSVSLFVNTFEPARRFSAFNMDLYELLEELLIMAKRVALIEKRLNKEIYNMLFGNRSVLEVHHKIRDKLPEQVRFDLANVGIKRSNNELLGKIKMPVLQ